VESTSSLTFTFTTTLTPHHLHHHHTQQVLSGCLELGQIEFCLNDKDNSVQFDDKKTNIEQCVSHCAEMLGFERTNLRFLLLHRLRVTPTETIKEPYTNVKQAIAARDAFAKELYSRVFRYIVSIVNSTLAPSRDYDGVIGILDIFGFESFKKNSYEQLLINYTNETLQNLFNEYVFKNEAVLYESEGLAEIASVAYQDNLPCCRLIDAEYSRHRFHGILSILNDVTSAPLNRNLTDLDFARELKKSFVERCREEAKISSSYLDLFDPNVSMKKGKKRSSRGFYDGVSFWIRHYAGIVRLCWFS
jgi:myosin V